LTLCGPTAINQSVKGSFTKENVEEIAVAKGKVIEILSVDEETGKLTSICQQEIFGLVRSMIAFRLHGM